MNRLTFTKERAALSLCLSMALPGPSGILKSLKEDLLPSRNWNFQVVAQLAMQRPKYWSTSN
jgi:hypothetical protein